MKHLIIASTLLLSATSVMGENSKTNAPKTRVATSQTQKHDKTYIIAGENMISENVFFTPEQQKKDSKFCRSEKCWVKILSSKNKSI